MPGVARDGPSDGGSRAAQEGGRRTTRKPREGRRKPVRSLYLTTYSSWNQGVSLDPLRRRLGCLPFCTEKDAAEVLRTFEEGSSAQRTQSPARHSDREQEPFACGLIGQTEKSLAGAIEYRRSCSSGTPIARLMRLGLISSNLRSSNC